MMENVHSGRMLEMADRLGIVILEGQEISGSSREDISSRGVENKSVNSMKTFMDLEDTKSRGNSSSSVRGKRDSDNMSRVFTAMISSKILTNRTSIEKLPIETRKATNTLSTTAVTTNDKRNSTARLRNFSGEVVAINALKQVEIPFLSFKIE